MDLQAKPKRKSTKPPVVQQAVIAKALIGATNSQIANDLDLDRGTVRAILSAAEIQQSIEIGRSDCIRMIPRSIKVIDQRLAKGSETAALAILRGTNVLQNQQLVGNQTNIVANTWVMMRQQKQAESAMEANIVAGEQQSTSDTDPPAK
jgi:hypothetical protein